MVDNDMISGNVQKAISYDTGKHLDTNDSKLRMQ